MRRKKITRREHRAGYTVYIRIVLLAAASFLCLFAAINIISVLLDYTEASQEYASIREYFPDVIVETTPAPLDMPIASKKPNLPASLTPIPTFTPVPAPTEQPIQAEPAETPELSVQPIQETTGPPANELRPGLSLPDINPDYAGWIKIEGTVIDYPVVRGEDNDTYLTTTFNGTKNLSGAIFMDYRCDEGFDSPTVIIYGHNMNDGSMFAQLGNYLDNDFFVQNPLITIVTLSGEVMTYNISAARVADVNDDAYTLTQDNPGTLVLSTCTNSRNDNERLIVLAKELSID